MNRQERLDLTADVYDTWAAKYDDIPDFDPDNPTPEQQADYYATAKEAGLPIGSTSWEKTVSEMSEAELEELRKLPMYQ